MIRNTPTTNICFDGMTVEESRAHLARSQFGNVRLTDAIRPGRNAVLYEGYKETEYNDGIDAVPVLLVQASLEKMCDLFHEILLDFPETVDVYLDGDHDKSHSKERRREGIDICVLRSWMRGSPFENMLHHDGCSSLSVTAPGTRTEIQWDDHKLLIFYGETQREIRKALRRFDIPFIPSMTTICEQTHFHLRDPSFEEVFDQFGQQLGVCGE